MSVTYKRMRMISCLCFSQTGSVATDTEIAALNTGLTTLRANLTGQLENVSADVQLVEKQLEDFSTEVRLINTTGGAGGDATLKDLRLYDECTRTPMVVQTCNVPNSASSPGFALCETGEATVNVTVSYLSFDSRYNLVQ